MNLVERVVDFERPIFARATASYVEERSMLLSVSQLWLIDCLLMARLLLAVNDESDIDLSQCGISQTCYREPLNCTSLNECNFAVVVLRIPSIDQIPIKLHSKAPLPKPYVSLRFVGPSSEGNLTYVYCSPRRTVRFGSLRSGVIFIDRKTKGKVAVLERKEDPNGIVRCDFAALGQQRPRLRTFPRNKKENSVVDYSNNAAFYGFALVRVTNFIPPALSQFRIVVENDGEEFDGKKVLRLNTKGANMSSDRLQQDRLNDDAKRRQHSGGPKGNDDRAQVEKKKEQQQVFGSAFQLAHDTARRSAGTRVSPLYLSLFGLMALIFLF